MFGNVIIGLLCGKTMRQAICWHLMATFSLPDVLERARLGVTENQDEAKKFANADKTGASIDAMPLDRPSNLVTLEKQKEPVSVSLPAVAFSSSLWRRSCVHAMVVKPGRKRKILFNVRRRPAINAVGLTPSLTECR